MKPALNFQAFRRFSFALLAFCLPLSIAASNAALGVACLAAAAAWAADPAARRYRWTGVETAWGLLFLAAVVSSLLAESPSYSLGKLRSEYLILFFVLAAQSQAPGDARRSLKVYAAAAALAGLWGVVQAALGVNYDPVQKAIVIPPGLENWPQGLIKALAMKNGRAAGFFSHPLTYSEILLLAWPLFLAGVLISGKISRRIAWGIGLALVSGGFLVSGSRTVWAALPLLLLVWAAVRRDRRVGAALLLVLFCFGAALAASPALRRRAASVVALKNDPSSQIRWSIWKGTVEGIRAHPAAGVGAGGVRLPTDVAPWGPRVWSETHNIFLQMTLERGLPGLAAFLFFLFALGRVFWRAPNSTISDGGWRRAPDSTISDSGWRRAPDSTISDSGWRRAPRGDLAGSLLFGYVGLLAAGLTESWVSDSEVLMSLYFLAGTAFAGAQETVGDPGSNC